MRRSAEVLIAYLKKALYDSVMKRKRATRFTPRKNVITLCDGGVTGVFAVGIPRSALQDLSDRLGQRIAERAERRQAAALSSGSFPQGSATDSC